MDEQEVTFLWVGEDVAPPRGGNSEVLLRTRDRAETFVIDFDRWKAELEREYGTVNRRIRIEVRVG